MRIAELRIEDVAFGGKGVAREQGKAVFVPFTIDGEFVSAEIVREKKQFSEAELVDLRERSPHRIEPKCRYFGRCGGCAYQHIDYRHQLEIKWRQVRDVLHRIGKLEDIPMRPIIPSPRIYAYRNRVTVHAEDGAIGYFRRDSHQLIDIDRCPIAMDEVNRELAELRASKVRDGHYTLRARSGPRIFSQTNDAVAMAIRELVARLVPDNQELLIDAYCGAGFFARALLDKVQEVIGIDRDKFAIEAAKEEATEKESYIAGDVEEELRKALVGAVHRTACERQSGPDRLESIAHTSEFDATTATTLIVDPPATGLTAKVRQTILNLSPAMMIYISCNPATLARDLVELQQKFKIESVTPLDMFPQTAEIEVVARLQASR